MPKLPEFKSLEEESDFWDTHSVADYLDEHVILDHVTIIDARPKKQIALRLAPSTLSALKSIAGRKGIGYQTLMRMWVMERLQQEIAAQHAAYDAAHLLPEDEAKVKAKERTLV